MLRACTRSNSFAVDMTKWVPAIVITAAKVLLFHDPTKRRNRKMYETHEKMYQISYNPPEKNGQPFKSKKVALLQAKSPRLWEDIIIMSNRDTSPCKAAGTTLRISAMTCQDVP